MELNRKTCGAYPTSSRKRAEVKVIYAKGYFIPFIIKTDVSIALILEAVSTTFKVESYKLKSKITPKLNP